MNFTDVCSARKLMSLCYMLCCFVITRFVSATRHVVPCGKSRVLWHFRETNVFVCVDGVFLNISTTYARSGSGYVVPSACAKAGVEALTK